ncbi:MAG: 16S rRNA (adenine(1518)-N(6)/adenine(1519)-N(6))-dimethyltransferase RsmA [Verrucomicrobiota bacterium]|nr:16S rRNA (adenine(1518)-N(6)/adenine(1519)-N(6))-dimethyltransferase RsmA [Verrucomicrobiota bacterium]
MPLSPSETMSLLKRLGHLPKKKLGQNFLIDGNIVDKSIQLADLPTSGNVVEIGPGLGTLTRKLLESGQTVHAVELDQRLADNLINTEAEAITRQQLTITRGDAVKIPLGSLPQSVHQYAIVANLPYAISSAWLESVLNSGRLPCRMVLMMQKEAVERIWANSGTKEYHALSIFINNAYEFTEKHSVSRQCFYPAPAVDSMLIRMDLREDAFLFSQQVRNLIRKIFTQRRKQIGSLAKKEEPSIGRIIFAWLDSIEQPYNSRPEQIRVKQWKKLGELLPGDY